MSRELLKKVSVRITVKKDDKILVGSGVLAKNNSNHYYVLTAEHCVFGKEDARLHGLTIENINIEYKHNNGEDFNIIKVHEISYKSEKNDIVALLVTSDSLNCEDIIYCDFIGDMNSPTLYFRGYPKWLNNDAKTYDCQIEEPDTLKFIIKSPEIIDLSLSKVIQDTTEGLSGSGVFCMKDGKIFLLGIVTNLRDCSGTFGHVYCRKLNDVFEKLNFKPVLISGGINELSKWKDIDRKHISSKIQDLREMKSEEYNRLERKLRMLYDDDQIEKMIDIFLTDFFTAEVNIREMSKFNAFINESFENSRMQLSRKIVKIFNNRVVKDSNEAQDVYKEVVKEFDKILKNENTGEIGGNDLSNMSDRAVVGLLLDCELDFVKHE